MRAPRRSDVLFPAVAFASALIALPVVGSAMRSVSPTASLYVATSGSDSAPCSKDAPCASLAHAFDAAPPGGAIVVEPGTYGDQLIPRSTKDGVTPVTVTAKPGARFSNLDIFGSHVEIRGVTTDGWYVKPGASDVVLRQVISTSPVFVTAASHVRVFGGQVYSRTPYVRNGSQLKEDGGVPPRDVVFDSVSFHDFRKDPSGSDHVDCLHILSGDGVIVRNSRFRNCEHFDILLTRFGRAGSPTNVLIENNFFSCCGSGYYALQLGGGHGEEWNNIVVRYNSSDQALNVDTANTVGHGVAFIANVAPHMPTGICSRGVTIDYNVFADGRKCGHHDRIAPSGFISSQTYNFHLRTNAAAIGAGDPSSMPRRDIDGQRRPQGLLPDAGADEVVVKATKSR